MDTFKEVVILSIIMSLAAIGFIAVVAFDVVQNAKIPDQEYGTVISKNPISNNTIANYMIVISGDKTLYISNNATLYASIQINQTYLFDCRIDFNNKMILVDRATQPLRTATA